MAIVKILVDLSSSFFVNVYQAGYSSGASKSNEPSHRSVRSKRLFWVIDITERIG